MCHGLKTDDELLGVLMDWYVCSFGQVKMIAFVCFSSSCYFKLMAILVLLKAVIYN